MRVLVVGGGGREHALVRSLSASPQVEALYAAPGNAGMAEVATCLPVRADDVEGLAALVERERIDLTVVGPEVPLVAGLADRLRQQGRAVFGPTAAAAAIEGSKALAKEFMSRHHIPTASYRTFQDPAAAREYAERAPLPLVVKADGLAAGKGVTVATTREEARHALRAAMEERIFGEAGARVVIEEFLPGREVSVFAVSDGERYLLLPAARDHKRALDGDQGPNTGGMGAYAPVPDLDAAALERIEREIIAPTLQGLAAEGRPFVGVLYAGLMLTPEGPKVVEFNCRLGDPETQVVLPLLVGDTAELFWRAATGQLAGYQVRWSTGFAVTVVLASGGYPGPYETGLPITGVAEAAALPGVVI
ncbi:MAG: phosphoribosylamine--glycine ligase, partial [Bacillota bacterium]|nr:phosphoribosylamine--glycine ligase [Bacillota bacterium]